MILNLRMANIKLQILLTNSVDQPREDVWITKWCIFSRIDDVTPPDVKYFKALEQITDSFES